VLARDTLNIEELDLFRAVMKWGERMRARLAAVKEAEAANAPADAGGEDAAAATPASVDMGEALEGVIDGVRFPLISPEHLRDVVQPALQLTPNKYCVSEALILEAYQHHALIRIGQASNVSELKTRKRTGSAGSTLSSQGGAHAPAQEALQRAKNADSRTYRWLEGLPTNAERISMGGMQLTRDSAVLLADFLTRRFRALVELDLKRNQLDRPAMALVIGALKHCPRLAGLAIAENPVHVGADDSRPGYEHD